MAKHIIKCAVCGVSFDTNEEQAVRHGARRYAHQKCYPDGEIVPMEQPKVKPPTAADEIKQIIGYVNEITHNKANAAMITRQVKQYKKENQFTASGILKTLHYWCEVKGQNLDKSNGGIGIVPYIYADASKYYYALYLAEMVNKEKDTVDYYKTITISVSPPIPQEKRIRLFNLEE